MPELAKRASRLQHTALCLLRINSSSRGGVTPTPITPMTLIPPHGHPARMTGLFAIHFVDYSRPITSTSHGSFTSSCNGVAVTTRTRRCDFGRSASNPMARHAWSDDQNVDTWPRTGQVNTSMDLPLRGCEQQHFHTEVTLRPSFNGSCRWRIILVRRAFEPLCFQTVLTSAPATTAEGQLTKIVVLARTQVTLAGRDRRRASRQPFYCYGRTSQRATSRKQLLGQRSARQQRDPERGQIQPKASYLATKPTVRGRRRRDRKTKASYHRCFRLLSLNLSSSSSPISSPFLISSFPCLSHCAERAFMGY